MKKNLILTFCLAVSVITTKAQNLYSVTLGGLDGTVNQFIPSTNKLIVHSPFADAAVPYGNLIQASDGKLYGMTNSGLRVGDGVLFSYDPATLAYTKLIDFDYRKGLNPTGSLIQASDGKLYGMTSGGGVVSGGVNSGVIFSFDPGNAVYTVLQNLSRANGEMPHGSLLQASDGKLYGTTVSGGSSNLGVIFSFDLSTNTYQKLKDFNTTDGSRPMGSLTQASDGKLYGMTSTGGLYDFGVIFSYDPTTATYSKLLDRDLATGGTAFGDMVEGPDGKLYGLTYQGGTNSYGIIFSFDPTTAIYTKLKDFDNINGAYPFGSLFLSPSGKFYGMTFQGGINGTTIGNGLTGVGVVFSFDPSTAVFTKLKDLDYATGYNPVSGVIQASDGRLYGVANLGGDGYVEGGLAGSGTLFSLDTLGGDFSKLRDFDGDKRVPLENLVQATDKKLYGITTLGRDNNNNTGSIFSFDPVKAAYTDLKSFTGTSGFNPGTSLLQGKDGKLYGVARQGGSNGNGTIYSYDPGSSELTKLQDFTGPNPAAPGGALMQAGNGKLYGVMHAGGDITLCDCGFIYSFDPVSSVYTKLRDFDVADGIEPVGTLLQATDGKLYGLTERGGKDNGVGTLFSFDPASAVFTKLKTLDYSEGGVPNGSLIQGSDGKLYGMTREGGDFGTGAIFSFDITNKTYTKLISLELATGASPTGSLRQAGDGKMYGMTDTGGVYGFGVIFSFDPVNSTYTVLQHLNHFSGPPTPGSAFIDIQGECATKRTYYTDADRDGYGNPTDSLISCTQPAGYVTNNTDCDDNNNAVHAPSKFFRDADNDGYGNPTDSTLACTKPFGYVTDSTDCDDNNKAAHTPRTFYRDADGDGFGDRASPMMACVQPAGYVSNNSDCDDNNNNSSGQSIYYRDADKDGFGDPNVSIRVRGSRPPAGYVKNNYDCDDHKKEKNPWNSTIKMCYHGRTQCIPLKEVFIRLFFGWKLGPCADCNNTGARAITSITKGVSDQSLPVQYKLSNYPNPFSGKSTIQYELPFDSRVSIKVYDLLGRAITTLVDENKKAGTYTIVFKAGTVNKGSLYYRIVAVSGEGKFEQTNKMIQLR